MKQSIIWVCTVLSLGVTCEAHEPTDTNWWGQYNSQQMAVGDWNGDGNADILIAEEHREPPANPGEPSMIADKHFRIVDGATQLPHTFALEPESEVLSMQIVPPGTDNPYPVLHTEQYVGGQKETHRYVDDGTGELAKEKVVYSTQSFFPPGAPVPSYSFVRGTAPNPGLLRIVVEADLYPEEWVVYLRPRTDCNNTPFTPFYRYDHCAGSSIIDMWLDFPGTGWWWIRVYDFEGNLIHEGQKNFV